MAITRVWTISLYSRGDSLRCVERYNVIDILRKTLLCFGQSAS